MSVQNYQSTLHEIPEKWDFIDLPWLLSHLSMGDNKIVHPATSDAPL